MLDPVGPLIWFLKVAEDDHDNPGIMMDEAKTAIADAVRLLGNASTQISWVQMRKHLKALNPDIQDLADEDIHREAAPDLTRPLPPVCQLPPDGLASAKAKFLKMEVMGIIRRSNSAWASPLHMVDSALAGTI